MDRTALITLEVVIGALVVVLITGSIFTSGYTLDALIWLIFFAGGLLALYGLKRYNTPSVRLVTALLAVICLGVGFASLLTVNPYLLPATSSMIMAMGGVILFLHWRMKRQGDDYPLRDERSLRIGTYGISCSWYLSYMVIIFFGILVGFGYSSIQVEVVLLLLMLMMPVSALLFQWYFNRKGDVY